MIIEDHSVVRAGLKSLIDRQPDMLVVAESSSTLGVDATISVTQPDVLVLDLTTPGGGSFELIRKLGKMSESPQVLVLTMHDDPAYVRSSLAAGAMGYIVKTVGELEMLDAIRSVAKGRLIIDLDDAAKSASVHKELNQCDTTSNLSEREFEVLSLLGKGYSNQEVATTLDISPKTVATYKARIGEKIGLKTTADFVKYATDNGMA
jgi:two-component system, NarL family, response regulator NreC